MSFSKMTAGASALALAVNFATADPVQAGGGSSTNEYTTDFNGCEFTAHVGNMDGMQTFIVEREAGCNPCSTAFQETFGEVAAILVEQYRADPHREPLDKNKAWGEWSTVGCSGNAFGGDGGVTNPPGGNISAGGGQLGGGEVAGGTTDLNKYDQSTPAILKGMEVHI